MSWLSKQVKSVKKVVHKVDPISKLGDKALSRAGKYINDHGGKNLNNLGKGLHAQWSAVGNMIQKQPGRLLIGSIDPFSTKVWNKVLNRDDKPILNQLGSPSTTAQEQAMKNHPNIDFTRATDFHKIGDTIAGVWGGYGAGSALGGWLGATGGGVSAAGGGSGALTGTTAGTTAGTLGGTVGTGITSGATLGGITVTGSGIGAATAGSIAGGTAGGAAGSGVLSSAAPKTPPPSNSPPPTSGATLDAVNVTGNAGNAGSGLSAAELAGQVAGSGVLLNNGGSAGSTGTTGTGETKPAEKGVFGKIGDFISSDTGKSLIGLAGNVIEGYGQGKAAEAEQDAINARARYYDEQWRDPAQLAKLQEAVNAGKAISLDQGYTDRARRVADNSSRPQTPPGDPSKVYGTYARGEQ